MGGAPACAPMDERRSAFVRAGCGRMYSRRRRPSLVFRCRSLNIASHTSSEAAGKKFHLADFAPG
jgi:hypothetical protein